MTNIQDLVKAHQVYQVAFGKYKSGESSFHYLTKAQYDLETQLWLHRDLIVGKLAGNKNGKRRKE